ncbi:unnamed protein product [Amoebophrya sp. A25]|nr:unnamed protein product [Amoebophrya sp. A25]|eukprot:GSA25T00025784001.1
MAVGSKLAHRDEIATPQCLPIGHILPNVNYHSVDLCTPQAASVFADDDCTRSLRWYCRGVSRSPIELIASLFEPLGNYLVIGFEVVLQTWTFQIQDFPREVHHHSSSSWLMGSATQLFSTGSPQTLPRTKPCTFAATT